jgi:phosphoribosylformimino-5-aminoimidazole carboxamide ribotide isomerase
VLIPSIDLMGGKIVQLVQGERKALEFSDFDTWIERFAGYPMVQLIDLDAAIGTGSNHDLLGRFTSRLPCQVGGGIRSVEAAQEVLAAGARKIIVGSALVRDNKVNTAFAAELARAVGADRVIAAVDSRGGKVAVRGWRELVAVTPVTMLRELEPYCGGFLYTHIETEGLMQGIPLDVVRELRRATSRQLIVAGGICSQEEVDALDAMQVDAVVGMAIYTGRLKA